MNEIPPSPARQGAFTFVLHTHLPYCRMAGRWPHGEEWIHEAVAETYIPLLDALYDLRAEGVRYRLTINLTPVLAEQLADADVMQNLLTYLDEEIEGAIADEARFATLGKKPLAAVAAFYQRFYRNIKHSLQERYGLDLIGAFRRLQDEGYLEIITCGATHGYLPLLARDSSIFGQLRTAVASYTRLFGRAPRAIWLPECAYRPAFRDETGTVRPALEEFLAPLGLTCFFVETHAIEGGRPVGKAAGETAIGPYGGIKRNYTITWAEESGVAGTTYAPYFVAGNAQGLTTPPVAVIGRNNRTGQQVWAADWGYPGDANYREFHKKDDVSGLQYWRVSGPKVDLGKKDYYDPEVAGQRVHDHARHYAGLVEQLLTDYHAASGEYGLIASNYDTELFGHWWFEGVRWIQEVLRNLAAGSAVELTTASAFVAEHPPARAMAVPESSWGAGGTHWTWDNPDTHWVWVPIHEAESRMERLVARYPCAEGALRDLLNQAARELLLLQASDWPFLVTTGQAKEYASQRFRTHVERFERLAACAEERAADADQATLAPEAQALVAEWWELDKLFPDMDYRWFATRQGRAT
jgi:1,4-alpha-glucan branching enzyme